MAVFVHVVVVYVSVFIVLLHLVSSEDTGQILSKENSELTEKYDNVNKSLPMTVNSELTSDLSNVSNVITVNSSVNHDQAVASEVKQAGVLLSKTEDGKVIQDAGVKVTESPIMLNVDSQPSSTPKTENEHLDNQVQETVESNNIPNIDQLKTDSPSKILRTLSPQYLSTVSEITEKSLSFSTTSPTMESSSTTKSNDQYQAFKPLFTSGSQYPLALMPGPVLQPGQGGGAETQTSTSTSTSTTSLPTWQDKSLQTNRGIMVEDVQSGVGNDNWYGSEDDWDDDSTGDNDINTESNEKTGSLDFWEDEKLLPQGGLLNQGDMESPTILQNMRPPKEGLVTPNFHDMAANEAVNIQLDMIAYYSWILIVSLAVISLLLFIRQRQRMGGIWPLTGPSHHSYSRVSAAEEGKSLMKNIYT